MREYSWALRIILMVGLLGGAIGIVSGQNLPVMSGKKIVASVNGELITLEEFDQELPSLGKKQGEKKNERQLLNRLINTRLIIQEGRRIGLDELPEIKNMVDVYSKVLLRELLIERQFKNIKVDEKDVERFYKESVKEWRVNSVLFDKEEGAKKFEEEIKSGKPFNEVAKRVIEEGKAKGGEEKNYLRKKDLHPQIAAMVSKMEVGSVSPIIPLQTGFLILKIEDIRYPENPEARELAKKEALNWKRVEALNRYKETLIKKYVKVHQNIVDRLDYEAKEPGFEALFKDKRVVAEIKGENPITVGELSEYIKQQFYHGVGLAAESKRLNSKKIPLLQEMLEKRVLRKEALRLGLDRTEVCKNKVKEYEYSVIFGAFIKKVVDPDIKIMEEELKAYYKEHIKEYTYPEMMKIESLVFAKRDDAEESIEKLRKGTEFQWLSANAEGQVDKNTKGLLAFGGKLLTTKNLIEGVQKVVSGVKPGDFKLYASPEGHFYVLFIQGVIPARPQPYEEAREDVGKKIFNEKVNKAIEDWADKLRAVSDVKVYLKDNN